jgi:hypothetical protein
MADFPISAPSIRIGKLATTCLACHLSDRHPISFPDHSRSQVKGGHNSGEIELIQAYDWLTADSTLDFQREFYACKCLEFLVENLILFTLKSIENH